MQITTDRLILREFIAGDWQAILAYQSDPRYLAHYPSSQRTPDDAKEFVQRQINNQLQQPRLNFQLVVELKSEQRLIGNCGVRKDAPQATQADIGYELDPRYWEQGYATEAARAMLELGFKYLNVRRIWAECIADNARSRRVLEKLGMRQEAYLRQVEFFKGRWWDKLIYAILIGEWHALERPGNMPGE